MIVETKQGLFNIFYPNDAIQNRLVNQEEWEPIQSLIAIEYLKFNSGNVIDFGANIGTFSIHVALAAKNTILAIDCQPSTFTQLCANIISNKVSNLIPLLVSISDEYHRINVDIINPETCTDSGRFSLIKNSSIFASLGPYPCI